MGTTASGLRYPEPADAVTAGATAVRNLAEDTDALVGVTTALATGRAQIAGGSYSGDGTTNRLISLPFTPLLVIISRNTGGVVAVSPLSATANGLQFFSGGFMLTDATDEAPVPDTGGFRVSGALNVGTVSWQYLALG